MIERPLGRLEPTDRIHVQKYGLTTATLPDKPTPVIAGTHWYSAFDRPTYDTKGRFWMVGKDRDLGRIRGGHAYCFKPNFIEDPVPWWAFYDQGNEGACVGFAISRAMSMLNRKRYWARWLYLTARRDFDEWQGEDYDGTSVRAGLDVARTIGHCRIRGRSEASPPDVAEGISSNRWAESVDDMIAAMHSPRYLELGRAPFLNSWGKDYPHITWMPLDVIGRLLDEGGEMGVIFDRD